MKFPKLKEGGNGWCKWLYPIPRKYKMACCDCGLVHTIQFEVIEQTTKETVEAGFRYRVLRDPKMRVRMRAKRDNAETKRLRKKDRITVT